MENVNLFASTCSYCKKTTKKQVHNIIEQMQNSNWFLQSVRTLQIKLSARKPGLTAIGLAGHTLWKCGTGHFF